MIAIEYLVHLKNKRRNNSMVKGCIYMLSKIIQKIDDKYQTDSIRFNFDMPQKRYCIVIFNKIHNNHINASSVFISDSEEDLIKRLDEKYIQEFEDDSKKWRGVECRIDV